MIMDTLIKFSKLINKLNEHIGRLTAWFTTFLVVLVCFDVITRYFYNDTAAWIMELEWHFFALIFLLGAGYTLKHDRHVRVDLFYSKFSSKDKALVDFIGNLLFLIPWCLVIIYFSYNYALGSYKIGESSPDPGGLPARYIVKFAIPFGITLLFLQAISSLIEAGQILFGKMQEGNSDSKPIVNEKL